MVNKDTTFFSEKRRAERILAPVGTTALIKNSAGHIDTILVKDISLIGMLASEYISTERYPIKTLINGFLLNFPPCELSDNSRICLLISTGKVVRSYRDQVSGTLYYGIEFLHDSPYTIEKIADLVNKFQASSPYLDAVNPLSCQ